MNEKSAAKAADFSFLKKEGKFAFKFHFLKNNFTKLQVW